MLRGTANTMRQAEARMTTNNAGGLTFTVDPWQRLDRFLLIGSDGGTYYVGARKLSLDNALNSKQCIVENGARAVDRIVEISMAGRAPSNDPALFALAMAASAEDAATRRYAFSKFAAVARTGTDILHLAAFVDGMRGWGMGLRHAFANWYNDLPVDKLAYQMVKYQSRDKWAQRDLLRICHPKTDDPARNAIYKWVVDAEPCDQAYIAGFIAAQQATDEATIIKLIQEHDLTREMLPTQWLNSVAVWDVLLQKMPLNAMVRNLGKMTNVGLLDARNAATLLVAERLHDSNYIRRSRLHPIAILEALKVYGQGHGDRGSLTWTPRALVKQGLNDAFYLAFGNVPSTGKNTVLGLDVSGSMTSCSPTGMSLNCAECATAMALVTARNEPNHKLWAFAHELRDPGIDADDTLETALAKTRKISFGGTNASLLTARAEKDRMWVDTFVTYTDSETWMGNTPMSTLRSYRRAINPNARQVVVGMTATEMTIADPQDPLALDVVGFDTATPALIAGFGG